MYSCQHCCDAFLIQPPEDSRQEQTESNSISLGCKRDVTWGWCRSGTVSGSRHTWRMIKTFETLCFLRWGPSEAKPAWTARVEQHLSNSNSISQLQKKKLNWTSGCQEQANTSVKRHIFAEWCVGEAKLSWAELSRGAQLSYWMHKGHSGGLNTSNHMAFCSYPELLASRNEEKVGRDRELNSLVSVDLRQWLDWLQTPTPSPVVAL